jgi:hypothetical protein
LGRVSQDGFSQFTEVDAMTPTVLALTALLIAADPTPMRKPHPLAPSLNQLTEEEEDKIDEIINRFIKGDTGQLVGEEAKQAERDFDALGPDAIPALIRGLNRAAKLEHSCPTLMIAKKLSRMLAASEDPKLLDFARDEIGTGVPRGKHAGILAELRTRCLVLRKNVLARGTPPPTITTAPKPEPKPEPKTPRTMTTVELVTAARGVGGTELKTLLTELEQRKGTDVLPGFSSIIKGNDLETQQYARDLMDKYMARQTNAFVKEKLKDTDVEIRRAALRVAAKSSAFLSDLIDALGDEDAGACADAHQGLLHWRKGEDFGPAADANKQQILDAQMKWRTWLTKTLGR